MSEKTLIFFSKVDWWMVVLVIILLLSGMALAAWVGFQQGNFKALIFVVVCEIITVGMALLITLPVRYELTDKKLMVRTGVLRSEVILSSIRKIGEYRSIMAGPTLSFDRLRIDYDNQGYDAFILVSPQDKQKFLEEIELRRTDENHEC
jgi:hypothetical protein